MNQLTNEEIAKVAAMHLGCDVSIKENGESEFKSILEGVNVYPQYKGDVNIYYAKEYGHLLRWSFNDCKLLLTPLHAITDEHAENVGLMAGFKSFLSHNGKTVIKDFFSNSATVFQFHPMNILNIYTQLVVWGYAAPLFFGLNHWANGKTAIELGIAIDKTQK